MFMFLMARRGQAPAEAACFETCSEPLLPHPSYVQVHLIGQTSVTWLPPVAAREASNTSSDDPNAASNEIKVLL